MSISDLSGAVKLKEGKNAAVAELAECHGGLLAAVDGYLAARNLRNDAVLESCGWPGDQELIVRTEQAHLQAEMALFEARGRSRVAQAAATALPDAPSTSNVYEATLAFSQALDAAPEDRTLLRRWVARFPQFEDDFITVGFSRFALGLDMQSETDVQFGVAATDKEMNCG